MGSTSPSRDNNETMSPENYTLTWDDYKANIQSLFQGLRDDRDHLDVTLACEDAQIHAHKVVLSASSPVFRDLLRREILLNHHHPIIFLRGVRISDLRLVLDFVYRGEVTVAQEDLGSFLAVGADLRIKGLTEKAGGGGASSNYSSPHRSSGQPTVESSRKSSNPSIAAELGDDIGIQGLMSQVKGEPVIPSAQLQDQTRPKSQQNVQKAASSVVLFTQPINENLSDNDCMIEEMKDVNDSENDLEEAQLKMGNMEDMDNCQSSEHYPSSRGLQYEEGMGPYQDPEEGYENNGQHYKLARKKCELCGKFISYTNMSRHRKYLCALRNLGD